MYLSGSSANAIGTANWNAAVTSWYNEVQYMNPADVSSLP